MTDTATLDLARALRIIVERQWPTAAQFDQAVAAVRAGLWDPDTRRPSAGEIRPAPPRVHGFVDDVEGADD